LPSERAYGFKMQMYALKHQGKRTDLFEGDNQNVKTRDIIGKENNLSGFQISNYLRLTFLIPEFLNLVDTQNIPLKAAVRSVYETLERGMELREMADYKENYSQKGAENLVLAVNQAIAEIEKIL